MKYRARYTPIAAAMVRRLHPHVKRQARAAVDRLLISPLEGHTLVDELAGLRSLRFGKYRIIYRINDTAATLDILSIGPRRDIYEELRERILREPSVRNS